MNKKKFKFTREKLYNLYINQKLSIYKTSKRLNCCPKTIQNYLNKFDIPIRSISEAKKGKKNPKCSKTKKEQFKYPKFKEEYLKKNEGCFKGGNTPWNRGLKGIHLSPKTEFKKGHKNPRKGKSKYNKFKKQICDLYSNKKLTQNKIAKKLNISQRLVSHILNQSNISIRNLKKKPYLSKWNKKYKSQQVKGENNPNFNNWSSREPYGKEFSPKLKEYLRKKFFYRCQQCFRHQDELKRKLHIHHIDFNKKNNSEENLIPLCASCHAQTQFKRENWIEYFQNKIGGMI